MITSIIGSFGMILRNPLLLLPALIAGIVNSLVLGLIGANLVELFVAWTSQGFFPVQGLQAPFYFVALHLGEFFIIALGAFVIAIVNGFVVFSYAEFVREKQQEKPGVIKAMINAIKALPKIALMVFFLSIISLMFVVFFIVSLGLGQIFDLLGIIITLFLFFVAIFLAVHFAFVLTALGFDQQNIKETLKRTWHFSSQNSWQILIFLVLLTVIPVIFVEIGLFFVSFTENELILAIIPLIITLIVSSFSNLSFALFYQRKSHL